MKKTISIILIAVFAAVLGSSTFYIVRHNKEADKQAELYHNLASVVEAAAQTDAEAEPTEPIPYSEEKTILPELAELFGQNGDLVGWISIADTNINYPVMQSVNEPNFYLKHGFDKEYSEYGCPYVQEDCDVQKPSDNLAAVLIALAVTCRMLGNNGFYPKTLWLVRSGIYIFLIVAWGVLIVLIFESCIGCGLIQSNSYYTELFQASTFAAQSRCGVYLPCRPCQRKQ